MSSTLTLSKPRSTDRRMAAQLSAARVSAFLRSRSPMPRTVAKFAWHENMRATQLLCPIRSATCRRAYLSTHRPGGSTMLGIPDAGTTDGPPAAPPPDWPEPDAPLPGEEPTIELP